MKYRGIIGVASHGKHTRGPNMQKNWGTKFYCKKKLPPVKFGPQNCPARGYGNIVPQFFRMFVDTVYAYHDNATGKNDGSFVYLYLMIGYGSSHCKLAELQLDKHNEKVKMIVQSMDCVEREFETRDENIVSLETRVDEYKSLVGSLQQELDSTNDMLSSLQQELEKSLAAQKVITMIQDYSRL